VTIQDQMVTVAGQRLRVAVRQGDPDRTPLLLMNGIGASLETFGPLTRRLDPSLTVISFDVPGIGGSPHPAHPYRLTWLCALIGRMLDELGHDTVDVLGISWGGGLAQQFAFTRRSRCRRLILVATGTGMLMVPGSPWVLAKMITPRRYRDTGYLRSIAPDLYGGSVRRDPASTAEFMTGLKAAGARAGYAYQLAAAAGWTSLTFLPLLRQPTLVLTGDDDPIIPVVNGRILAGLIRGARLHVYPGGHLELAVNPDLLVPAIEEFLIGAQPQPAPAPGGKRTSTADRLLRLFRLPAALGKALVGGRGSRSDPR
jgi:poly(3-hydroxyalkanoate) depolymerase